VLASLPEVSAPLWTFPHGERAEDQVHDEPHSSPCPDHGGNPRMKTGPASLPSGSLPGPRGGRGDRRDTGGRDRSRFGR